MTDFIHVGIVDRHAIVRNGLKVFLETRQDMALAGEAGSHDEAFELYANPQLDVVLFDYLCEKKNAYLIERLHHLRPQTRIMVLSTAIDPPHVLEAVWAGAVGYLFKQVDIDDLAQAIRRVFYGERVFDPEVGAIIHANSAAVGR